MGERNVPNPALVSSTPPTTTLECHVYIYIYTYVIKPFQERLGSALHGQADQFPSISAQNPTIVHLKVEPVEAIHLSKCMLPPLAKVTLERGRSTLVTVSTRNLTPGFAAEKSPAPLEVKDEILVSFSRLTVAYCEYGCDVAH